MPKIPVPRPGLGTSKNTGEQCADTVETALELNYRHVDTAQMYDNEGQVGKGLERANVDRDDVFLATKVHPDHLEPDHVRQTTESSLGKLGVEYVDLLYVHWPIRTYDAQETLLVFDELRDEGKVEHVGVSNFTPELLDEAREVLDSPILANQVEMHPLLQQDELLDDAREHDMYLVAYAPLMRGEASSVPELAEIAEKHAISPEQVCLAWLFDKENVVPIPKATGRDHLEANFDARSVELDVEDVERIEGIDRERRLVDPDDAAWNR